VTHASPVMQGKVAAQPGRNVQYGYALVNSYRERGVHTKCGDRECRGFVRRAGTGHARGFENNWAMIILGVVLSPFNVHSVLLGQQ
jgi:hypothetical protein